MKHMTINTARDNFEDIIDDVIELGEPVSIATDKGAAIMVSQDEWSGLLETCYLHSIPDLVESIITARQAPASERLESVGWDIN